MENPAAPGCPGCFMLLLLVRTMFWASGGGASTSGGFVSPFSPCAAVETLLQDADICKILPSELHVSPEHDGSYRAGSNARRLCGQLSPW